MRNDPEPREKRPVQLYAESHRKLMELATLSGMSAARAFEEVLAPHLTKRLARVLAKRAKGAA